jgi:hypothetical protein
MISLKCEICLVNKKCVAYQPCGHISCWSCADRTEKKCSNCRGQIDNFLRIYL